MSENSYAYRIARIRQTLPEGVTLVCVSKYYPIEAIQAAYDAGERDFGESRVQDLLVKYEALPKDIRWHFIGHLQTNKVKQIVPFIHLIHSVDSVRLLETINKEAARIGRIVPVLLEVHTATETTKSGFSVDEIRTLLSANNGLTAQWSNSISNQTSIAIRGLMTMATNTDDEQEIRRCFRTLKSLSTQSPFCEASLQQSDLAAKRPCRAWPYLSMGMSDDYLIAIEEGATIVRIGSAIFHESES